MGHVRTPTMTPAEFLDWEERQEGCWEFDGIRPVAMNGGTVAHTLIEGNLTAVLVAALRGTRCRRYGPGLKLQIGDKYRYPDSLVACGSDALTARSTSDPVVVFEILSPSTERNDRTVKVQEYTSLSSVERYVMLEQDQAFATVISRIPTGWRIETFVRDGTLLMPEIGITVPMAEIYDGLDFPPLEDDGR